MKANSETLISDLIEKTKKNLNQLQELKKYSLEQLNYKSSAETWSILECIEHLNIYGEFYLPEIEKSITKSNKPKSSKFKAGILGNYFVKLIEPKEKLNKMKTVNAFNPINSSLTEDVLIKFEKQQYTTLDLLSKALNVNLTKLKTGTSLSKFINMRLGDTLRFVIAHNQRHLNQASRIVKA